MVKKADTRGDLHRAAVSQVRASAQSEALARVEDMLTEEEQAFANSSNTVYDLQGRMVQDAKVGGLYIVDGKKVVM